MGTTDQAAIALAKYTREELIRAIGDLTDGNSAWYEIQEQTCVDEDRSKELSKLAGLCINSPAYLDG